MAYRAAVLSSGFSHNSIAPFLKDNRRQVAHVVPDVFSLTELPDYVRDCKSGRTFRQPFYQFPEMFNERGADANEGSGLAANKSSCVSFVCCKTKDDFERHRSPSILQDRAATYAEKFTVNLTKIDGSAATISNQ